MGTPEPIYGWGALPPEAVPAVLVFGDARLRKVCTSVESDAFGNDDHSTLRQGLRFLAAALDRHDGAAIAAPQVGITERVVVVSGDVADNLTQGYPFGLINPKIMDRSEDVVLDREGCLSFPKVWVRVPRPVWVHVGACTPAGDAFEIKAYGFLARALCHEIEHLDGGLLIDHTAGLKQQMIEKKMAKFRRRLDRRPKQQGSRRRKRSAR